MISVFTDPDKYLKEIYGGQLGRFRIDFLLDDLNALLKWVSIRRLLDVGAGHAPVTLRLLSQNKELSVHLVEPSARLLDEARALQRELAVEATRVAYTCSDLNGAVRAGLHRQCDLIVCHTVANWTEDPRAFVTQLARLSEEARVFVSLVVGAAPGKAFRYVLRGEIEDAIACVVAPGTKTQSLIEGAPVRPLDPDMVLDWITGAGCEVLLRAGVRVFADYMPSSVWEDRHEVARLRELEERVRYEEKYWRFGQLVHVIFGPVGLQEVAARPLDWERYQQDEKDVS